jgi:hypothetical protein
LFHLKFCSDDAEDGTVPVACSDEDWLVDNPTGVVSGVTSITSGSPAKNTQYKDNNYLTLNKKVMKTKINKIVPVGILQSSGAF